MGLDLVLRGGRVIDPSQGIDARHGCRLRGRPRRQDRREGSPGATSATSPATLLRPASSIFTPMSIVGGTSLGVDPLRLARGGCTTLVDTGSAGPGNYPGFLEHVIRPSPVRILAFLNVSFAGIYGFSKRVMVGESGDLRLMAPIDAIEVARANPDTIVGIKVRVGLHASQNSGVIPLDIARQTAEELGLPMMVHIDHPPPTLEDVLARMRKGDILTHCFRPFPNNPSTADGGVREAVIEARDRGRDLRHWPRHGIVRVQDREGDAGQRLPARLHLERRPRALHRRSGVRSPHDDVEVPLPRHGARRRRAGGDGSAGQGASTRRPRQSQARRQLARRRFWRWKQARSTMSNSTGEHMTGDQRLTASGVVIGGRWWNGWPSNISP